MKSLREWELTPDSPYEICLAADARLSQTDYANDQSWDIHIGRGDEAAFAIQTKYGGRVGLASIVPMWHHDGQIIYQAQQYEQPPQIRHFLPGYIAVRARLHAHIQLEAEHIALDSQTICGLYHLSNASKETITLRCNLFGHVGAQGQEQKLALVTARKHTALGLGIYPGIAPVVMIDGGTGEPADPPATPKIGITVTIPAGKTIAIRWVHAGMSEYKVSVAAAELWLAQDWQAFRKSIEAAASAIPVIQTGNPDWDLVLASSYNRVMQSLLTPAGRFPGASFVMGRMPESGASRRGDGSDHPRMWEGQDVSVAYLIAPLLAAIHAPFARDILRNYLVSQDASGVIDLKPGAAGQQANLLCTPLITQMALRIYEISGDTEFLKAVFDPLLRFAIAWMLQDKDGDGVPEWQHERQTGYLAFPTFAAGQVWAQGANIATVESPDLLAYLLAEFEALAKIATILKNKAALKQIQQHIKSLQAVLPAFWNGTTFVYRDRDTHRTLQSISLLRNGAGDQKHALNAALPEPNRLVITIVGGVSHIPNITLHILGSDIHGNPIHEAKPAAELLWQNRQGVCTTQQVFAHVEQIYCDGLSRVYTINAATLDTTAQEISTLIPLLTPQAVPAAVEAVAKLALDKKKFLRPNGITMINAQSSAFDPASAEGAGGIGMFWQTLLGTALLRVGAGKQVAGLARNLLDMLVNILSQHHQFSQFYHSDETLPLGERGHLAGIAPLDLLHELWGIRILNNGKVWIGKDFWWDRSLVIQQHGITVRRTRKSIKIVFPSGYRTELKDIEADTIVQDPEPSAAPAYTRIQRPPLPDSAPGTAAQRVRIHVEHEE